MLKDRVENKSKSSFFHTLKRLHPYQTMMYMAMIGSGILFVVFLTLYIAQRFSIQNQAAGIFLPKSFYISTAVMLLSAAILKSAKNQLQQDKLKKTVQLLIVTLILATLFIVFQVTGWVEFYNKGFVTPTSNVASSYVYVLTIIHCLHVLIAISFLVYILVPYYIKSKDAVSELILITNPFQKKKLNMLFIFWYYVDVVWLVMFFCFAITFSI